MHNRGIYWICIQNKAEPTEYDALFVHGMQDKVCGFLKNRFALHLHDWRKENTKWEVC